MVVTDDVDTIILHHLEFAIRGNVCMQHVMSIPM